MTEIDFFGGVDEIGGNKISVKENENSVFLDFGMSFNISNQYFSEFLQPRKNNGILDFIEFGLLPRIKGIYREDYLKHSGLTYLKEPTVDGVLISHAHMDHSAYVHHLREDIPIYMTQESYFIMKALQDTSATSFNELITLNKTFHLRPKKRVKEGTSTHTKLKGEDSEINRDIRIINPYKEFLLGDIKVQCAPVDHSLPGACAYLLDTDDDRVVYTGDLRFHGRNSDDSREFVKRARKFQPTVMLCEGTRMERDTNTSEESIMNRVISIVDGYHNHVIVNYPIRDLDRFLTFYEAAQRTGRTMVVSLKEAYILNLFTEAGYYSSLDVAVYIPKKGWGIIGDEDCLCIDGDWVTSSQLHQQHLEEGYKKWERKYLELENTVNYKDIRDNPTEYIFSCDFFELKELIDIKPEEGLYFWSKTEPFNDEMEIDYHKVKNWINHFNLEMISEGMHGSGHANRAEILKMIQEIQPEKIYPIHTEKKQEFEVLRDDRIDVVFPELNH